MHNITKDDSQLHQTQNDFLRDWLPFKGQYLALLMDMEAPPLDRACSVLQCDKEGIYRCDDCFMQPLFCTSCCREQHVRHPLHRVHQWVGQFFDDSSLRLVSSMLEFNSWNPNSSQAGMEVNLGHGGSPCPNAHLADDSSKNDDPWEDVEDSNRPAHLRTPEDFNYITVVDTTGVHFWNITYCNCPDAGAIHFQLLGAQLFSASITNPRTVFTFRVLDDFLRDNVECGTSAMNYFSKLRRITSSAFPHLVVVCASVFTHKYTD